MSFDFSPALSGQARADKIRQMAQNHPATEKSRHTLNLILRLQQGLRQMPAAQQAQQLALLQEVGRIVQRETTHLVEALTNVTLDQQDTDKAIARMTLNANLLKATNDDQAHRIGDLEKDLMMERHKRLQAEDDARKAMEKMATKGGEEAKKTQLSKSTQLAKKTQPDHTKDKKDKNDKNGGDDAVNDLVSVGESANSPGTPLTGMVAEKSGGAKIADGKDNQDDGDDQGGALIVPIKTPKAGESSFYNDKISKENKADSDKMGSPDMALQLSTRGSSVGGPVPRGPAAMMNQMTDQMTDQMANQMANNSQQTWLARRGTGSSTPGSALSSVPHGRSNFQPRGRADSMVGGGGSSNMNGRSSSVHASTHAMGLGGPMGLSYGQQNFNYSPMSTMAGERPSTSYGNRCSSMGHRREMPRGMTAPAPWGMRRSWATPDAGLLANEDLAAFGDQLTHFYAVVREFVERHAGEAAPGRVSELRNSSLWPLLLSAYYPLSEPEAEAYLEVHMGSEHSKACVVTRLIVSFVVSTLWTPAAWSGFDPSSTYQLMELDGELKALQGHPYSARQPFLHQLSVVVSCILRSETSIPWQQGKIVDSARRLHATVSPLMNRITSPGESERDARRVADAAWRLSARLQSCGAAFEFSFPDVGIKYAMQSMMPIWPHVEPVEMQARQWRVSLAVTPMVVCRAEGTVQGVTLADVFCMA